MYITSDEAQRIIALLGEDADANRTRDAQRSNETRALMNEINNRYVSLVGQSGVDGPERQAQLKSEADARTAALNGPKTDAQLKAERDHDVALNTPRRPAGAPHAKSFPTTLCRWVRIHGHLFRERLLTAAGLAC